MHPHYLYSYQNFVQQNPDSPQVIEGHSIDTNVYISSGVSNKPTFLVSSVFDSWFSLLVWEEFFSEQRQQCAFQRIFSQVPSQDGPFVEKSTILDLIF